MSDNMNCARGGLLSRFELIGDVLVTASLDAEES